MADALALPASGMTLDGRYRLVRELGSGGMGMVFEAVHLRLRTPVAIKILRPEFAKTPEFQIRFDREARASTLIQSAHAVRVFDVATSSEGLTYMVMELLSGNDLGEEAERGPPKLCDVADWIVQTCSALQAAHDQGIVHRDVKPANIFLANEGEGRIAKVLDFGISKFEHHITAPLTKPIDGALGTPTFMSPEQIRGRRVSSRTDIWSLGVVLYRILANRWPFAGENERAYMAAVLTDPAIPFELVRPDLPYEFATVVMQTLEKKPEDRFATAAALAAALAPFGSGKRPLSVIAAPSVQAAPATTSMPDTERDPIGFGSTARIPFEEQTHNPRAAHGPQALDDSRLAAARTIAAAPVFGGLTPSSATPGPISIDAPGATRRTRPVWVGLAGLFAAVIGFAGYLVATRTLTPSVVAAPGPSQVSQTGGEAAQTAAPAISQPASGSAAAGTSKDREPPPRSATALPPPTGVARATSAPRASVRLPSRRATPSSSGPAPSSAPAPAPAPSSAPAPAPAPSSAPAPAPTVSAPTFL